MYIEKVLPDDLSITNHVFEEKRNFLLASLPNFIAINFLERMKWQTMSNKIVISLMFSYI